MASPAVLYQAGDHASRPANGAGCVLYSCTDHDLVYRDDGTSWTTFMTLVGGSGGDIATDAIWDAAGDLAVGSGANTAARLAIGATDGMAVRRVSGAVAWALPPGHEFDYAAVTSTVSVIATAAASATNIVSGNAVTYDGSTAVVIEFFSPDADFGGANVGDLFVLHLYDGASEIGFAAVVRNEITGANANRDPLSASVRLTPTAAAHTYHWKGTVTNAGRPMAISGGAGGSGARYGMYIRITKV